MKDILIKSSEIQNEADEILFERGLHKILQKFGEPNYVGSYELKLMLKKDLDISLINPSLTLEHTA